MIAMVAMMFESTVNIAYYKDVFFAIVTLLNYTGMYIYNTNNNDGKDHSKL